MMPDEARVASIRQQRYLDWYRRTNEAVHRLTPDEREDLDSTR